MPRRAGRERLASHACDACKIRKIRCTGAAPCMRCRSSSIECTFNLQNKTRGPRGMRDKTLHAITETQCSTADDGGGDSDAQLAGLLPLIELYEMRLYPIWPIVNATELKQSLLSGARDAATIQLANALALATTEQLKLQAPITLPISHLGVADICEDDQINCIRIAFFKHIYYENLDGGGTKSLLYLREAITRAQILRLEHESTYPGLTLEMESLSRRIFWLLFVTERGVALLHKLPVILKPNLHLPWQTGTGDHLPDSWKLTYLFWMLDQSGIFTILAYSDNPFPPSGAVSKECVEAIQHKLLSFNNSVLSVVGNDVQRADILVTRHWMRTVLWRVASRSGNVPPALNPLEIANDFLTVVSQIPFAALESHGPTLDFKIYEIANAVLDAKTSTYNTTVEARFNQVIHGLQDLLTSCRGGNDKLATLLSFKMNDTLQPSTFWQHAELQQFIEGLWPLEDANQSGIDVSRPSQSFAPSLLDVVDGADTQLQAYWPSMDLANWTAPSSPITRLLLEVGLGESKCTGNTPNRPLQLEAARETKSRSD